MRSRTKVVALAASVALFGAFTYDAGIPYFSRTRIVTIASPDKRNVIALDADIWKYARPEFPDLRIYDGQSKVPYALVRENGGSKTQESEAKLLNLGSVGGHTEFDLDTGGAAEYDRVRLQIDTKNFINSAQVEGRRALNDGLGTRLGGSTLYDFSKEGLGANSVMKFASASFPYLHVRLAPGIQPDQVKGAYLASFQETKAAWTSAGSCTPAANQGKRSVFQCSIFQGMPVERVSFSIPQGIVNFNRTVTLSDEHGDEFQSGSISRVRMHRGGQDVTSEDLAIDLYPQTTKHITVTVENGDDSPLPIQQVQLLAVERRLYFDPKGKTSLRLYYGDPKLEAPSYDYAKFFQQAADAVFAQLGGAEANAQYAGRPDDRPWTERHSVVLWAAMFLAVMILGGLALRGLKRTTPSAT